jgi:hypothetical protein
MKKVFNVGLSFLVLGFLTTLFALGGGLVKADVVADPTADLYKILIYLGGGFLVLGIIMITSATISLRR